MGRWLNLAIELSEARDNSTNSANSSSKNTTAEPVVPSVTIVTPDLEKDGAEANIIAWINSHPPDLPDAQNQCAACGEYIEVYDVHWIYLADGALIHYSGKYDNKCWKRWQVIRRDNANTALETSKGA